MLLMFTSIIAGATFAGVLGALRRPEDLLHPDRRVRLPLPVPDASAARSTSGSGSSTTHPGRSRSCSPAACCCSTCSCAGCWPRIVKWWEQAKEGGEDPRRSRARTSLRVFLPSLVGWVREARRDRRVPRRVRDPGHVPHDDAHRRRQLDRERHLGDPGRSRREPGVQRRLAERRHRRRRRRPPTRSRSSSSRPPGTSCSRSSLLVWAFGWTGGKQLVDGLVHRREGEGGRAEGRARPPGRRPSGSARDGGPSRRGRKDAWAGSTPNSRSRRSRR